MKHGLHLAGIQEPGLLVDQERSGIRRVSLRSINGRRVGCFGAAFTGIHKDQVFSRRRIRVRLTRKAIVNTRYLLSTVISSSYAVKEYIWF